MGERSLEALDVAWARTAPARVLRESVMERVRAFFERAGADTTPAERSSELAGATAP